MRIKLVTDEGAGVYNDIQLPQLEQLLLDARVPTKMFLFDERLNGYVYIDTWPLPPPPTD
jgi:hypothetical protein